MRIEEQVLSIEQARHLQELGLDMSDAALCWYGTPYDKIVWQITTMVGRMSKFVKEKEYSNLVPTYTLQEVLGKLPYDMTWDTWQWQIDHCGENMEYNDGDGYTSHREIDGSLLDKAYKILCWVLENGYLKEDKK